MKTAVSLPEPLFKEAGATASRLRVSRSQLYATALSEFLERVSEARVTEKLNEVYAAQDSGLDPSFHRAQILSLGENSW